MQDELQSTQAEKEAAVEAEAAADKRAVSAEIRAARQAEEATRARVEREVELAEAAEAETLVAMTDKERYVRRLPVWRARTMARQPSPPPPHPRARHSLQCVRQRETYKEQITASQTTIPRPPPPPPFPHLSRRETYKEQITVLEARLEEVGVLVKIWASGGSGMLGASRRVACVTCVATVA